jgi:hippurate hydrolase
MGERLSLTQNETERLVGIRELLHRFPELAFEEFKTSAVVQSVLSELGISYSVVAGTGIMAELGTVSGPIVALRADMDALPIVEASGLPFSSEIPGCMHACGHDIHTTWLLGAAMILKRVGVNGRIRLLFQPAEEVMKGAPAMIAAGALEGVSAIFGAHVDRNYRIGEVVVQAGAVAAASDRFKFTITGQSAHGARPHQGRDPIVAAGELIGMIQTISSRNVDPADPIVITIGTISGGTAGNVIAASVEMTGTIRSVRQETRAFIATRLEAISDGLGQAMGVSIRFDWIEGVPPIENLAPHIDWVAAAVTAQLGGDAIRKLPMTNMASEDFAIYLQKIPGAFMRIGVCEPGGKPIPAHAPEFYVSNDAIPVGAEVMAQMGITACAIL